MTEIHLAHPHAVAAALRHLGEAVIAEARAAVADTAATDAAAVHNFRKAMKHWRAVLRLVEPFVGAEARRLRDEARDLARVLAGARDARSALDALMDLGEEELSARTRASIATRLDTLRLAAEKGTLDAETRRHIDALLATASEGVRNWSFAGVDFADVARSLAAGYDRARRALPKDWLAAAPEDLHALRQRVVVHRYQMELAEPLWPRLGRFWVAEAQRLRDRLGHHQDLEILSARTAPHQPLAPWRSRLTPLIAARKHEHVLAAARLSGRLFAESPKAFRRRLVALWDHRTITGNPWRPPGVRAP
jgi:CHAD domain-containing protein